MEIHSFGTSTEKNLFTEVLVLDCGAESNWCELDLNSPFNANVLNSGAWFSHANFYVFLAQVEMCCWENYKQHRDKQEKLKYFRIPQEEQLEDAMLSKNSELFETELEERPSRWARIRPQVWRILDEPYSSSIAKV